MEIMEPTSVPFKEMGESIAEQFFHANTGKTLTELVASRAQKENMSPEEVKRLVEKTNTAASINYLSSGNNKKGSFELAKYEDVLNLTHPIDDDDDDDEDEIHDADDVKTAGLTKSASLLMFKAGKTSGAVKHDYSGLPRMTKQASANEVKDTSIRDILVLKKNITLAQQEKTAEELKVSDDINYILSEFDRWRGPDFNKFASEALSLYGEKCAPVINGIAKYLGVMAKVASVDYVDDTQPCMKKLASAMQHLDNIKTLSTGIGTLNAALDYVTKKAKSL